jgi:hypothetical protein
MLQRACDGSLQRSSPEDDGVHTVYFFRMDIRPPGGPRWRVLVVVPLDGLELRGAERRRGRWGGRVDGLKRHYLPQIEMRKGVAIIKERVKDDDEKGVGPKEESSDHDLHAHAHAHVVRSVPHRILYIYLHGNYSLYPTLLYILWRTCWTEPRSHRTPSGIILPPYGTVLHAATYCHVIE